MDLFGLKNLKSLPQTLQKNEDRILQNHLTMNMHLNAFYYQVQAPYFRKNFSSMNYHSEI